MKKYPHVLFKANPKDLIALLNELKTLSALADETEMIIGYAELMMNNPISGTVYDNNTRSYLAVHIAKYREIERLRIRNNKHG